MGSAAMAESVRRDLNVRSLAIVLRDALDLHEPEVSLSIGVPAPLTLGSVVTDVDAHAWLAWCVGTLPLFSGGLPANRRARDDATRVLSAIAYGRTGSITYAATAIKTSRKVVRLALRASGLLLNLKRKPASDE